MFENASKIPKLRNRELHMERSTYAHFQLKPFTSYRNRKARACAHFKNIILLMLIIYFRPNIENPLCLCLKGALSQYTLNWRIFSGVPRGENAITYLIHTRLLLGFFDRFIQINNMDASCLLEGAAPLAHNTN